MLVSRRAVSIVMEGVPFEEGKKMRGMGDLVDRGGGGGVRLSVEKYDRGKKNYLFNKMNAPFLVEVLLSNIISIQLYNK